TQHPWANRRLIDLTELHQQRLLQLPDTFVMRRMCDAIFRQNQVRPRVVAEINAIETLLRSLQPLKAAALMPTIALSDSPGLAAVRRKGKNLAIEIGLLRLIDSDASTAVQEFTKLARSTVPLMIRKQSTLRPRFSTAAAGNKVRPRPRRTRRARSEGKGASS